LDEITQKKIFIHIPKNAGSTIQSAEALQGKIVNISPEIQRDDNYAKEVLDHVAFFPISDNEQESIPADEILQQHCRWLDLNPAITKKYNSFAVIRNPWARVASRYFYALKESMSGLKVAVDVSSFESFIGERHYWGNKPYMWHSAIRGWYCAADYVTDLNGNLVCDMLSFENLDTELCEYFSLESPPPRQNITGVGAGKYANIYTKDTIQIIADWYKKDIEMFGYDFDTGPTKNTWKEIVI
jgi:hypothetical protein